jgi:hypothetical protein
MVVRPQIQAFPPSMALLASYSPQSITAWSASPSILPSTEESM